MEKQKKGRELLRRYLSGESTEQEKLRVERFYLSQFKENGLPGQLPDSNVKEELWEQINNRVHGVGKWKFFAQWYRVAAVLAFLLIGTAAAIYYLNNRHLQHPGDTAHVADIAPGKNRATLHLSDGRQIALSQEKAGIKTESGSLTYLDGSELEKELPAYLTLSTPRGGQYHAILPDGTKVWLNASSSLRYSATFETDQVRKVKLQGEAYFEVVHNPSMPFIVESDGQQVKVLGTSFNVQAYEDDGSVKTTLLEGSVQLNPSTGKNVILRPGEQAILNESGMRVQKVNVEDFIAWKNGYFMFNSETLESIMTRLGRWYDVQVEYADKALKDRAFFGSVSRYEHLSKVLEVLEATGAVNLEIKGKTVTVSKAN